MKEIVILGACRTAIGSFNGSLARVPAVQLGAEVISQALARAGLQAGEVQEVLLGCALSGGLGQNPARQAAIRAGLPEKTPALTVNCGCGSGLKTLLLAAALIKGGEAGILVAGGMETMSAAPYLLDKLRDGYRMGDGRLVDSMVKDGVWDAFGDYHVGVTAERVAREYGVSREEQDAYALESQRRAKRARETGRFKEEILALKIPSGKNQLDFDQDEYPRPQTTLEGLGRLRPAFEKGGTVTLGNSSGLNDGAAAMVVMSREEAERRDLVPQATLRAGATVGLDPALMGMGPYYAARKILDDTGLTLDQIDLFEFNEAFAAQTIAVIRALGVDPARVNVNGGAIALGHPVGASGARILVSLLHEMEKRDAKRGLAALAIGGGMGIAALVER